MKRALSYILLTLYLINIFGVLWPYLEYAANKEYIAKVLCINKDVAELNCEGKCFLAERIKTEQQQRDKETTLNDYEVKLYLTQTTAQVPFKLFKQLTARHQKNITIHFQTYYSGIFHPPKLG